MLTIERLAHAATLFLDDDATCGGEQAVALQVIVFNGLLLGCLHAVDGCDSARVVREHKHQRELSSIVVANYIFHLNVAVSFGGEQVNY